MHAGWKQGIPIMQWEDFHSERDLPDEIYQRCGCESCSELYREMRTLMEMESC